MTRWRIDIIRKRAEHLGTVEAFNEKDAIEKAAKEFDIPPERRNRLVAQKIGAKGYRRSEELEISRKLSAVKQVRGRIDQGWPVRVSVCDATNNKGP
jgi:hypothetical protein